MNKINRHDPIRAVPIFIVWRVYIPNRKMLASVLKL